MGEGTAIQWAHHTFNPWRGCAHVSPGCANCYAEALAKRNPATLGTWGVRGERAVAAESYWRKPHRWDRLAAEAGERHRVFCASLADVFEDRPDLEAPRARLFALITATPHLDWLLLTKRPEVARRMLTADGRGSLMWAMDEIRGGPAGDFVWPLPNVWVGTTVEDQRRADERIPTLLDTPAAVRFLSCEPLLGPVDLYRFAYNAPPDGEFCWRGEGIDWVIVGGESGPRARPMDLAWARGLVEQGRAAGVPVFVKQLGRRPIFHGPTDQAGGTPFEALNGPGDPWELDLRDSHGGDPAEWPADLRIREVPSPASPARWHPPVRRVGA